MPASIPLVPLVAAGAPAAAAAAAAVTTGSGVVDATPQARFVSQTVLSSEADAIYPGSSLVKAWRLENNGASSWPAGCRVVSVQGEAMGTPAEGVVVNRLPLQPGKEVDVCLRLTAPQSPGRHQGYWRMMTPDGTPFGHRLWADIVVENSNLGSVMSSLRESIGATKKTSEEAAVAAQALAQAASAPAPEAGAVAEEDGATAASGGGGDDSESAASSASSIQLDDPSYERYRDQLEALHGMGLRNQPLLVHHLDAQKGDVQRVVQALWGN